MKPILIEKPHSLSNPLLWVGMVVVVVGTGMAHLELVWASAATMGVGILILLFVITRGQR